MYSDQVYTDIIIIETHHMYELVHILQFVCFD